MAADVAPGAAGIRQDAGAGSVTETPTLLDPSVETWALEFPGELTEEAIHHIRATLKEQMPGRQVVVVQGGGRFRVLLPSDVASTARAIAKLSIVIAISGLAIVVALVAR